MKDYNIDELIEYRKNHTLQETADYYETSKNYINALCFKHKGHKRDDKYFSYCYRHTIEEIMEKYQVSKETAASDKKVANVRYTDPAKLAEYFLNHTQKQTQEHFNMSLSSIYHILKSNGFELSRHKTYDDLDVDAFKEYCKDHTMKEVVEHFRLSLGAVRWLMEKHNCYYRRKQYLQFKTTGKNVYVLTKDNEELCFPRIDDIAKYFDRTNTHINVLINTTGEVFGYRVKKIRMIYYIG